MSFSADVKEEICRQKLERKCCALAESFGVLLFCHTFSPDTIRISTANAPFMARLPKLFKNAFGLTFALRLLCALRLTRAFRLLRADLRGPIRASFHRVPGRFRLAVFS